MPAKTHFVRKRGYGVTVIGRSDEGHRTVREVIVRSEFSPDGDGEVAAPWVGRQSGGLRNASDRGEMRGSDQTMTEIGHGLLCI